MRRSAIWFGRDHHVTDGTVTKFNGGGELVFTNSTIHALLVSTVGAYVLTGHSRVINAAVANGDGQLDSQIAPFKQGLSSQWLILSSQSAPL